MKSNVPWSVKGIDPEARVVAKEAARKAGMTLGEWMNQTIREVGQEGGQGGAGPEELGENTPQTGVTTDQLRAVVDSLNRLNERLRNTEDSLRQSEETSRRVAGDLGAGLETVYERMKRLEREKAEGTAAAIESRVEKLERGEGDKGRIEGLKTLERALTHMVEALEVTRHEAIGRINENEEAVQELAERVELMDGRLTAGFAEVHDAIDAVGQHLDRTERTAKAVMLEAREAAESTDAEFVARTSQRLQILGNEIKRSGDQIRGVEDMVAGLSEKIEAAEHRSAEGIGEVASTLEALRRAIAEEGAAPLAAERAARDEAPADVTTGAEPAPAPLTLTDAPALDTQPLAEVAAEADKKVSKLQRSYEAMMARLEGRTSGAGSSVPTDTAPDGNAAPDGGTPPAKALSVSAPEQVAAPLAAGDLDEDADQGDAEFDAVFGEEPSPKAGAGARDDAGTPPPLVAPTGPAGAAGTATGDGGTMTFAAPEDELAGGTRPESAKESLAKLTPRQKVLLAAKARKKRLAAEHEADGLMPPGTTPSIDGVATDALPGGAAAMAGVTVLRDTDDGGRDAEDAARAPGKATALRERIAAARDAKGRDAKGGNAKGRDAKGKDAAVGDRNAKLGLFQIALMGLFVVVAASAYFMFFGSDDGGNADQRVAVGPAVTAGAAPAGAAASAPPPAPAVDAEALYAEAKTRRAAGDGASAFRLFREAADAGYAPAAYQVGEAYYSGVGVAEDVNRARSTFMDAAISGNVLAMHRLGLIEADEASGGRNMVAATDWFDRAASYGVVDSMFNLGYLYDPASDGNPMPADRRDAELSYAWYARAAARGDEPARDAMATVASQLDAETVARLDAETAEWTPLPLPAAANDGLTVE